MDIRLFKDDAKRAATYLGQHGVEVSHTRLLEALAHAFGERNWSTLRARLQGLPELDAAAPSEVPTALAPWTPADGPMTTQQFVSHGGARCPVCGSDDVEGDTVQADGDNAWDDSRCLHCGSSWNTAYRVYGYFDLELGAEAAATQSLPFAPGVNDANRALLAQVPPHAGVALVERAPDRRGWLVHLYEARAALPVLLADDDRKFATVTQLVAAATDAEDARQRLEAMRVPASATLEVFSQQVALEQARAAAPEFTLTLLDMVQADVVSDLVEDVKARQRKYGFSVRSFANAMELVDEAAGVLVLAPTELERVAAATALY